MTGDALAVTSVDFCTRHRDDLFQRKHRSVSREYRRKGLKSEVEESQSCSLHSFHVY